jgi:hypothetical protein
MNDTTIRKALHDENPGVRENAIQIAELYLPEMPGLEDDLLFLENDTAAKVRYQLLCTLGNLDDAKAETARQKLLIHDIEDKWVQVAALSSFPGKEYALIEKTLPVLEGKPSDGKKLFFNNCAAVIGLSQRPGDIKKLMRLAMENNSTSSIWWQAACLEGLATAVNEKGKPSFDMTNEKVLLLSKFNA